MSDDASTVDEQRLLDAWIVFLDAALGDGVQAYSANKIPADLPQEYLEVGLTRRLADSTRMSGGARTRIGWRLTTRAVALTEGSARVVRRRAATAQDVVLTELDTTPLDFEGEQEIEHDDGRYSGLTTWAFTSPSHIS